MNKKAIYIIILLGIWIFSPVKVITDSEDIVTSDVTEPINEKDIKANNSKKPISKIKVMKKPTTTPKKKNFRCDGRIYCSQMRSCEEATFFIRNCVGTKMDGDGDGRPCERQHCR